MGTGFAKQKKHAKQLQEQMLHMQQTLTTKLNSLEVTGEAGNGLVTITLAGTGEMKKVSIKPDCVDPQDIEGLETLIKAAYTTAFKKVQDLAESTGNMGGIPDLSMFGL